MNIADLIEESHEYAKSRGFWDNLPRRKSPRDPDHIDMRVSEPVEYHSLLLALVASEAFEALDKYRKSASMDDVADELADVVIRVADWCGGMEIDLEAAILRVQDRSKDRPRLHGKRF